MHTLASCSSASRAPCSTRPGLRQSRRRAALPRPEAPSSVEQWARATGRQQARAPDLGLRERALQLLLRGRQLAPHLAQQRLMLRLRGRCSLARRWRCRCRALLRRWRCRKPLQQGKQVTQRHRSSYRMHLERQTNIQSISHTCRMTRKHSGVARRLAGCARSLMHCPDYVSRCMQAAHAVCWRQQFACSGWAGCGAGWAGWAGWAGCSGS